MNLGLLVVRIVVGLLFVGHGAQKLFGSFGGHGLQGTGGFFESLGLRPGRQHALAAGVAEFGGGALLALGLLTPLAATMISATMIVAIWTVHAAKGVWNANGGYELNLIIIAAVFALAGVGAGSWSLDHALGLNLAGTGWAIASLAAALVGAAGAVLAGRSVRRPARTSGSAASAA